MVCVSTSAEIQTGYHLCENYLDGIGKLRLTTRHRGLQTGAYHWGYEGCASIWPSNSLKYQELSLSHLGWNGDAAAVHGDVFAHEAFNFSDIPT